MAITPLGADEYGFVYNGESSKTYGVYITDGAFYSAPMRDTTRVEIPGRNGAFLQDHGRFKNIQVVYRCTLYTEAETDFISGIAAVRAWLCSVKGYARLTDDFNPNEYRMAAFVDGIEVSNIRPEVGTFDITFDAKPQRFLTSGETAQTIASSGDTITNPTNFPSRPLLEVTGYGKIGINEDEVEIISGPIGRTPLLLQHRQLKGAALTASFSVRPNYANMNSGDNVQILGGNIAVDFGVALMDIYNFSQTGDFVRNATGLNTNILTFDLYNFVYQYGTAKTASASVEVGVYVGGTIAQYATITVSLSISATGVISITVSTGSLGADGFSLYFPQIYGNSTKSALGDPVYIDLDIGEAYKVEGGAVVGVNSAVSLGAELPELHPGENEITFDNTITNLDIVPRWWTV
ncbi:MAG: phage tail family protein [Bacteroidales bacterium]|nr:phage tail family protein [Bacteroidales bacterium]